MKQASIHASTSNAASDRLKVAANPVLPASMGWLARVENAFVAWQAKRLAAISPERLWAQAMQDTRSFAEIRRAARK